MGRTRRQYWTWLRLFSAASTLPLGRRRTRARLSSRTSLPLANTTFFRRGPPLLCRDLLEETPSRVHLPLACLCSQSHLEGNPLCLGNRALPGTPRGRPCPRRVMGTPAGRKCTRDLAQALCPPSRPARCRFRSPSFPSGPEAQRSREPWALRVPRRPCPRGWLGSCRARPLTSSAAGARLLSRPLLQPLRGNRPHRPRPQEPVLPRPEVLQAHLQTLAQAQVRLCRPLDLHQLRSLRSDPRQPRPVLRRLDPPRLGLPHRDLLQHLDRDPRPCLRRA